jgi:lipopolysaccharide transport system ATP-binding protein
MCDLQYQKKCVDKMMESGREGRTVLFVSHNLTLVSSVCRNGILITDGRVDYTGSVEEVVDAYLTQAEEREMALLEDGGKLYQGPDIEVLEYFCCDESGHRRSRFFTGEPICIAVRYQTIRETQDLRVGIDIVNQARGELIFRTYDDDVSEPPRNRGLHVGICRIPGRLLMPGHYGARLLLSLQPDKWLIPEPISRVFSVEQSHEAPARMDDNRPGIVILPIEWDTMEAAEKR